MDFDQHEVKVKILKIVGFDKFIIFYELHHVVV